MCRGIRGGGYLLIWGITKKINRVRLDVASVSRTFFDGKFLWKIVNFFQLYIVWSTLAGSILPALKFVFIFLRYIVVRSAGRATMTGRHSNFSRNRETRSVFFFFFWWLCQNPQSSRWRITRVRFSFTTYVFGVFLGCSQLRHVFQFPYFSPDPHSTHYLGSSGKLWRKKTLSNDKKWLKNVILLEIQRCSTVCDIRISVSPKKEILLSVPYKRVFCVTFISFLCFFFLMIVHRQASNYIQTVCIFLFVLHCFINSLHFNFTYHCLVKIVFKKKKKTGVVRPFVWNIKRSCVSTCHTFVVAIVHVLCSLCCTQIDGY